MRREPGHRAALQRRRAVAQVLAKTDLCGEFAGHAVGLETYVLEFSHERIGRVWLTGLGLRGERSGPETDARQDEKKSDHWVLALLDAN